MFLFFKIWLLLSIPAFAMILRLLAKSKEYEEAHE